MGTWGQLLLQVFLLLFYIHKGFCVTLPLSGLILLLNCRDPLHLFFFHLQVRSQECCPHCGPVIGDVPVRFIQCRHQCTEDTSHL